MVVFEGSKIESVSLATLSTPLYEGGLGLIDIVAKSKALKLSYYGFYYFYTTSECFLSDEILCWLSVGEVQIRLGPPKR